MKPIAVVLAAAIAACASVAAAQTPQVKGDADKPMTNCPTSDPKNAQSAEKSAILPAAEGHEKSAAPTVQRDGKTAEADANCVKQDNTHKDKKG